MTDSDFRSSRFRRSAYTQVPYSGVTDDAEDAYERVLNYVGANWNDRNPIDARLVGEVRTGAGRITALNDPAHGTEWSALLALRPTGGVAPYRRPAGFDTDRDGMPDAWEVARGLDPNSADNNGDFDGDGYTNLEEYINEIAEWPAPRAIVRSGDGRYERIDGWDIEWQPSRHDEARIVSGTTTIDSVGQYAGALEVAADSGDVATLSVGAGWIEIVNDLMVGPAGSGRVDQAGGEMSRAVRWFWEGPRGRPGSTTSPAGRSTRRDSHAAGPGACSTSPGASFTPKRWASTCSTGAARWHLARVSGGRTLPET